MQLSALELKALMDKDPQAQTYCLIDVRRVEEYALCNLGAKLIPMQEIVNRFQEIPKDKLVIIHCHHGARSQKVIDYLEAHHGYSNLANLSGGIHAWSLEIDPRLPVY